MTATGLDEVLAAAADARRDAPPPTDPRYDDYCRALADRLRLDRDEVLAANAVDLAAARERGLGPELLDRLAVTAARLDALVGLADRVRRARPAALAPGPPVVGAGGLVARRVPKPLGVLLMIFEARPTVTVEGALLPVAVGNTVLLRGGAETAATSAALALLVARALAAADLPPGTAQVLPPTDHRSVRALLQRHDVIDVLVPRGSPTLVDLCRTRSSIPVLASGGGVNHLYVDRSADPAEAAALALDSKLAEPTACNTLNMVLAHRDIAVPLVRALLAAAARGPEPATLRLDPRLLPAAADAAVPVLPLTAVDDGREFLDRSFGVRPVDGVDEAVAHVRRHGTGHTEGVVAADPAVAARFAAAVDAAAVVVNGSLRLHDGPTMGLGPELSISTGRLHVRGPVGLAGLVTYGWLVEGGGRRRGPTAVAP